MLVLRLPVYLLARMAAEPCDPALAAEFETAGAAGGLSYAALSTHGGLACLATALGSGSSMSASAHFFGLRVSSSHVE